MNAIKHRLIIAALLSVQISFASGASARSLADGNSVRPLASIDQAIQQVETLAAKESVSTSESRKLNRMIDRVGKHLGSHAILAENNLHRQLSILNTEINQGRTPLNTNHVIRAVESFDRVSALSTRFSLGGSETFSATYWGERRNETSLRRGRREIVSTREIRTSNVYRDRLLVSSRSTPISRATMLYLTELGLLRKDYGRLALNHQSLSSKKLTAEGRSERTMGVPRDTRALMGQQYMGVVGDLAVGGVQ